MSCPYCNGRPLSRDNAKSCGSSKCRKAHDCAKKRRQKRVRAGISSESSLRTSKRPLQSQEPMTAKKRQKNSPASPTLTFAQQFPPEISSHWLQEAPSRSKPHLSASDLGLAEVKEVHAALGKGCDVDGESSHTFINKITEATLSSKGSLTTQSTTADPCLNIMPLQGCRITADGRVSVVDSIASFQDVSSVTAVRYLDEIRKEVPRFHAQFDVTNYKFPEDMLPATLVAKPETIMQILPLLPGPRAQNLQLKYNEFMAKAFYGEEEIIRFVANQADKLHKTITLSTRTSFPEEKIEEADLQQHCNLVQSHVNTLLARPRDRPFPKAKQHLASKVLEEVGSVSSWVETTLTVDELWKVEVEEEDGKAKNVYFVRIQGSNFVKIGYSGNIFRRMSTLQTACPQPLELEYCFLTRNYRKCEKLMHQKLQQHFVRGEWFNLPQGFDFIKATKDIALL